MFIKMVTTKTAATKALLHSTSSQNEFNYRKIRMGQGRGAEPFAQKTPCQLSLGSPRDPDTTSRLPHSPGPALNPAAGRWAWEALLLALWVPPNAPHALLSARFSSGERTEKEPRTQYLPRLVGSEGIWAQAQDNPAQPVSADVCGAHVRTEEQPQRELWLDRRVWPVPPNPPPRLPSSPGRGCWAAEGRPRKPPLNVAFLKQDTPQQRRQTRP